MDRLLVTLISNDVAEKIDKVRPGVPGVRTMSVPITRSWRCAETSSAEGTPDRDTPLE
jgi:hypothetical protein